MAKKIFTKQEVAVLCPQSISSKSGNFLKSGDVPYLKQLVIKARQRGYSRDDGANVWAMMLNNKSRGISFDNREMLDLSEALTTLFQNLSYYEAKQHYVAFLEFNSRPEKYAD